MKEKRVRASESTPANAPAAPAQPLDSALAQTREVQAKLNSGAQELFVVHEVLKQEIPPAAQTAEVAEALDKHEALEEAVQECADDLEDVSRALASEVARREELEKQLSEARAEQQPQGDGGSPKAN